MNGEGTTVYVAGHAGMVGSAITRRVEAEYPAARVIGRRRSELDLSVQADVDRFFSENAIDVVYLAAAKVGGIYANNLLRADFVYQNLMIQCNVINAAFRAGVGKLAFLGSSCIYPRTADQPIREDALLTAPLEPTNEPYAIAKIAGIKLCESFNRQHGTDYRCLMPTNLYGPHDNFDPDGSHVVPGLMQRMHLAKLRSEKSVAIWGSGSPLREFLHVDDLAAAATHIMSLSKEQYLQSIDKDFQYFNVGRGEEISIRDLAVLVSDVVGYQGELRFDASRPDGSPRKALDCSRLLSTGWRPSIQLREGLEATYEWYLRETES